MMKYMTAGAALLLTTTAATAGGIDRSGQFLGVLFEEGGATGSYAQLSFGRALVDAGADGISNPLSDFSSIGLAYKTEFTDQLSFALIADEPFGAEIEYTDGPFSFGSPLPLPGNGQAFISSTAVTGVLRYEFTNGFSVHGGLRAQEVGGSLISGGGVLAASSDYDFGYLVGAAYERPDIALRIALTYNSELTNEFTGTANGVSTEFEVDFPASWNLEFQTGVAQDTLLFGSVRYVEWDGFSLNANGIDFASFDANTTLFNLGVGRRINDNFSVFASLGFEEPTTRPSTTALAPTTGIASLAVGGSYTYENVEFSGGITYAVPGDQVVTNPIGADLEFDDNEVIGVGIRIGYNF